MSKSCPKCHRPNADNAVKCLYCNAAFSAANKADVIPAPRKDKPVSESYLVTMSPVTEVKSEWISGLSRLTGWDGYLVRQKLMTTSPWVIRSFYDMSEAQSFVQRVTGLGLDSYLIKKSGLNKLRDRLFPVGMSLEDNGMSFLFEGGEKFSFSYDRVFLIVRGRLKEDSGDENAEEGSGRVSLGSIFITDQPASGEAASTDDALERLKSRIGNIKLKRRKSDKRWSSMKLESQVMDIYFRGSHRCIRVLENGFNFNGLGEARTDSSMLNFNIFLQHLLDKSPGTFFDDEFKKISYTLPPSQERVSRQLELTSAQSGGDSGKLYSYSHFFSDYSSRIYLHYLRKSKAVSS